MPTSERGGIVRVPFPYTDRSTRQRRPALVVSSGGLGPAGTLLWVVMITSAENRGWPGDLDLGDAYSACGLPAPSIVRTAKIATVEATHTEPLGILPAALMGRVEGELRKALSLG
jgi:mRNA interferase MazF